MQSEYSWKLTILAEMTNIEFKAWRLSLKMTQDEFAAFLGYQSRETITRFESGKRPIPARVSKRYAAQRKRRPRVDPGPFAPFHSPPLTENE